MQHISMLSYSFYISASQWSYNRTNTHIMYWKKAFSRMWSFILSCDKTFFIFFFVCAASISLPFLALLHIHKYNILQLNKSLSSLLTFKTLQLAKDHRYNIMLGMLERRIAHTEKKRAQAESFFLLFYRSVHIFCLLVHLFCIIYIKMCTRFFLCLLEVAAAGLTYRKILPKI